MLHTCRLITDPVSPFFSSSLLGLNLSSFVLSFFLLIICITPQVSDSLLLFSSEFFILSIALLLNISRLADSSRILSFCHFNLVVLIEARVGVFTVLPCYSVKLLSSSSRSTSLAGNFLSLQTMMKLQMESL